MTLSTAKALSALPMRTRAWFAFAALASAYVLFSAHIGTGWLVAPWDKAAHFALYASLAGLLWLGCAGKRRALIVLAVSALGAADELMQATTPGRSGDLADWSVDTLSAVIVIAMLPRIQRTVNDRRLRLQMQRR